MALPQVESMKQIPGSWEIKGAPMPPSPENKAHLGIINRHNPLLRPSYSRIFWERGGSEHTSNILLNNPRGWVNLTQNKHLLTQLTLGPGYYTRRVEPRQTSILGWFFNEETLVV